MSPGSDWRTSPCVLRLSLSCHLRTFCIVEDLGVRCLPSNLERPTPVGSPNERFCFYMCKRESKCVIGVSRYYIISFTDLILSHNTRYISCVCLNLSEPFSFIYTISIVLCNNLNWTTSEVSSMIFLRDCSIPTSQNFVYLSLFQSRSFIFYISSWFIFKILIFVYYCCLSDLSQLLSYIYYLFFQ